MELEQAIQSWRSHLAIGSKWTVKILGSNYIGQIVDVYYNRKVGSIMVDFDVLNHFWELTYRVSVQDFVSKYGVEKLIEGELENG
jgi:hypothetical protein